MDANPYAPLEANPYAPPAARVADHRPNTHGLKRRSLWLMLLFVFLTLGLYYLIWFFRRRPGLNRLDSSQKVPMWPLLGTAAFWVAQFVMGAIEGIAPGSLAPGPGANLVMLLAQAAVGVSMIFVCFRIRDIIQDHATPPPDPEQRFASKVELSGVMTFFLGIFYLQWAINKYVVGGQKA